MKQNPLNIILADDVTLIKKFYLISGNEITLIEKVKEKIINVFQKSEKAYLTYIESISDFVDSDSLFENKKMWFNIHRNDSNIGPVRRAGSYDIPFVVLDELEPGSNSAP